MDDVVGVEDSVEIRVAERRLKLVEQCLKLKQFLKLQKVGNVSSTQSQERKPVQTEALIRRLEQIRNNLTKEINRLKEHDNNS